MTNNANVQITEFTMQDQLDQLKRIADQLEGDYKYSTCTDMNSSWRKVTITWDKQSRTDRGTDSKDTHGATGKDMDLL